jgi:thymidylate synthase (FAD)
MNYPINDPYFRVEVLSKTERPNLLSYLAMHQCYSENVIIDEIDKISKLSESELGKRVVDNCLKFGHYSVIEPPHITFCVSGFPHNVMVQATRHRLLSFSVQSQRYTGKRVFDLSDQILHWENSEEYDVQCIPLDKKEEISKIFYFRPIGQYLDRNGNKYEYSKWDLESDIFHVHSVLEHYHHLISNRGFSPEHARDMLPQNIRQDFVVTFNARSLLHFCDLRLASDAQLEIRTMAEMLFEKFKLWMPECSAWYDKNRARKNKLAP